MREPLMVAVVGHDRVDPDVVFGIGRDRRHPDSVDIAQAWRDFVRFRRIPRWPELTIQRHPPFAEYRYRVQADEGTGVEDLELLLTEAYDDGVVTEVIRPAAVVPEDSTRRVLMELALHDVRIGGNWWSEPATWRRYSKPWDGYEGGPGSSELLGTIQIAYGVPTRYEITIFRATVTRVGGQHGFTVASLCDEALGFGGLTLGTCPRADLKPPPQPFRFRN